MNKGKNEYDDDPVVYCKRCLSLNIQQIPMFPDKYCCCECGTLELCESPNIEEWKALYREKYGHDFVEKRKKRPWPYWC